MDPVTQATLLVPPAGHVAGVYAATDQTRGVHKPPANVDLRGIVTNDLPGNKKPLSYTASKGDQDVLNPRGVNVIRDFRADRRGIRVWGARTLADNAQWKYVNVRRLFMFVEESVEQGTQWVVFEPNDEFTWARVTRSIENFLTSVWRGGALMGTTPDEAFQVRCDRTTMTQDDIEILRFSQRTVEANA
jgi:phage tail sheath protein FI